MHLGIPQYFLKILAILLWVVLFSPVVIADTFHLVINGKSFHRENKNYNESNTGIGFEMEFNEQQKNIKFIAASTFKDSVNNTSNYFGGGIKRRFRLDTYSDGWYSDVGLIAFVMTRKDYNDNQPFVSALPIVTLGKGRFAINTTYIPKLSPKASGLFYLQAKVRLTEW